MAGKRLRAERALSFRDVSLLVSQCSREMGGAGRKRCERDKLPLLLLFGGVPSPNLFFRPGDRINGILKYLLERVAANRSKPPCHPGLRTSSPELLPVPA